MLGDARDAGLTLLRWSWLIAAAALAGVLLATALSPESTEHKAVARLGLTEEVRWPFFNSTRQRIAGLADDLDPLTVVTEPDGLVSVSVSLPANEAFLNVEAVASTPDLAVRAADEFAARLIELDSPVGVTAQIEATLADAAASVAELEASLAQLDQENVSLLERQVAAEAELNQARLQGQPTSVQNEALLARNTADLAVSLAKDERDRILRRLGSLEVEQDRLELELVRSAGRPQVAIIRDAVAEDLSTVPLLPRQLVGGLTGAVVAGLLVWLISENFGPVRSPAAVRSIAGVTVIDARDKRGPGRLAVWLHRLDGPLTVGFVGGGPYTENLLAQLQRTSAATTVVHAGAAEMPALADSRSARRLVDLGSPEDGSWFDRATGVCDEVVLLVPHNWQRPAAVRRLIEDVTSLGTPIWLAVMIPGPRAVRRSSSAVRRQLARA